MIDLNRSYHLVPQTNDAVKIKIIGLGGAGSNALDRILLDGIDDAELVAMNSDVQSLTSSVANEKVQLGREATRGLGAGGDPEVGFAAAEEAMEEIRAALDGAGLIFLCAGLGGGTGSGAAPLVASLAKEHGALVVVFATMPFSFEGKRRAAQAHEALAALQAYADAVICFENDTMGDAVSPKAGIHQAFAAADETISQSVRAISQLFARPGILRIGFDELRAALSGNNARCLFGYGEAEGDNRAHDALALALKNPLMDRGRMLHEAHNLVVNVAGGPDMTLAEVQILMEELGRHLGDETHILFGAAVDPKMGPRLGVTLLSSTQIGVQTTEAAAPVETPAKIVRRRAPELVQSEPEAEEIEEIEEIEEVDEPEEASEPLRQESRAPRPKHGARPPKAAPEMLPAGAAKMEPKQETLQFEAVTRGRFEKSEPTIVDGHDLDVPTFLRQNVRVK
ncbi:MAG: cell division protein FtsZ [Chthoniobacter sp.]|jgi:cell division protein FtsZ|nr:cell division protein FtsZ [Chthoniobacter sp.]